MTMMGIAGRSAVLVLLAGAALAQPARPGGGPATAEAALWAEVRDSTQADDLQAYLDAYPGGAYAPLARRRMQALGVAPAGPAPVPQAAAPQAVPARAAGPAPVQDCDRLAQPTKEWLGAMPALVPGVDAKEVTPEAGAACAAAMVAYPDESRFVLYAGVAALSTGDVANGVRLLRAAAGRGVPLAFSILAEVYLHGVGGVPPDMMEAVRLLRQAVAGGDPLGAVLLGRMLTTGEDGLAQDLPEAARLIGLALDADSPNAKRALVTLYATADRTAVPVEARRVPLLRSWAEGSDTDAQRVMAGLYEIGASGVRQDRAEAIRLYALAAAAGSARAKQDLNRLRPPGPAPVQECDRVAEPPRSVMGIKDPSVAQGLPDARIDVPAVRAACTRAMQEWPDEVRFIAYAARAPEMAGENEETVRLYRLAAGLGNAYAQFSMGAMYLQAQFGLPQDDKEAVRYLRLAAAQGVPAAQVPLANMHLAGSNGVPKDPAEAVRLCRLAAEARDADGLVCLAGLYDRGEGGLQKDDREVVRLYRLAVIQNSVPALAGLGSMHAEGRGVARDDVEAVRLFRLAVARDDPTGQLWLAYMTENGRGGLARNNAEALRLYRLAAAAGFDEAKTAVQRLERSPAPR